MSNRVKKQVELIKMVEKKEKLIGHIVPIWKRCSSHEGFAVQISKYLEEKGSGCFLFLDEGKTKHLKGNAMMIKGLGCFLFLNMGKTIWKKEVDETKNISMAGWGECG